MTGDGAVSGGTPGDRGTPAGTAADASRPRIAVMGGAPDEPVVAALDAARVEVVRVADAAAVTAAWAAWAASAAAAVSTATAAVPAAHGGTATPGPLALVIDAVPEQPEGEKSVRLGALLGALPAAIPVVTVIDRACAGDLALPARAAGRLTGLHLVRDAGDGARPLAELAVPLGADPELADAVLVLLELAGMEIHPVGDEPGRVVRRMAAVLAAERVRAGSDDDALEAALANEGYRIAGEGGAGTTEIDRLVPAAGIWPEGPFAIAGRMGLRALVEALARLREAAMAAGDADAVERFTPAPALWRVATV